jgi:hypothetical protein
MASKYLNSLSKETYDKLTERLRSIQNNKCYICRDAIDLKLHNTNIDHIIPLANRGKDSEDNFALTHESCNKSKQDANLDIARVLHKLKKIQGETLEQEGKAASLKHVIKSFGGSKYDFKYKIENDSITYSFSDIGDNRLIKVPLFEDNLSKEKTCFIEAPIEYIHHDEIINPRGINNSISKLIKEFEKGNPQLHLTIARINNGKIMVFDGQHKAVAQILLGSKKLVLRLFLNPDIDRLIETNTNAGSTLRQIAFDKSIMSQLNNTLYAERVKKYQQDHTLNDDDFSFSEQQLIDYFKGENVNIKKYIIDSIRHSITHHKENKLKDFVDFEGKAKELPISYSAFDKTFLRHFVNPKIFLSTLINHRSDEGLNPRELEINQAVRLLSLIAEKVYIGKFKPEIGVYRIEKKIIDNKDTDITDDHLVAFRISKEEVIYNWLQYLIKVIENYFNNTGRLFDNKKLFQERFDDQLWQNIENFLDHLSLLPLWKDRSMATTIFAGKQNYDFWKTVFQTGKSPDGADVLAKSLNFIEMIKPLNSSENC